MPSRVRARRNEFPEEAAADYRDQRDDQRLDVTKAFVLQKQDDENIERGDANTCNERNTKEQIERDGGSNRSLPDRTRRSPVRR